VLVLRVLQGPDRGRQFDLPDDEPQLIGRSSESLSLTDQTISRRHAELTPDDGRWYINDLKSSNGTYVNGVRVAQQRKLQAGDQIRTGMTLMVLGENEPQRVRRNQGALRVASKNEIEVSVEQTVESNDDSMIMAVPDPDQAADFQLKVIYELASLIGTVTDQQQLLERVMDVIFEYFNADRGFILLQEDEEARPEPTVVRQRREADREPEKPIYVSRTIVGYVMRKGVGVLSSNAMNDTRFSTGDSVQAYGIRSALCVPIKFKNKLYGVINLDSKVANYTYTEHQLTLLTAIGVQTGLALHNASLQQRRVEEERLAAVGQTVASLSHSIKNILQGMRGGADLVELGQKKESLKVVGEGWDIVSRNLDRIYELVMNMLAFSKQREPELEMINLDSFLNEVVGMVQSQFDAKQVAMITDFGEDVPPVPVDPGAVHQAVLNLLNNALDAVEPESGVVSLRTEYDPDGQLIRIAVIDNGEGMDESTQQKLFQPFHSTKGLRGTGLGLVVTKKVIEEHHGWVEIESEPGEGSTFTLTIPLAAEGVASAADTHGPAGQTADASEAEGETG